MEWMNFKKILCTKNRHVFHYVWPWQCKLNLFVLLNYRINHDKVQYESIFKTVSTSLLTAEFLSNGQIF